ncbi:DUF4998 domain-containing protein [Polaribacter sp. Hel_I_88]|uniref:DUF4998 domain-containing protein n=1 Tax=Polaribacter sp. Hel_I_88 TaxID=1250006 RepID=UPI000A6E3D76|nr:DUF4998 domain-containing protein [Polaribacter sp. Hel_I_88]
MNNSFKNIVKQIALTLVLIISIIGCNSLSEDDYKKFTEGGEILYSGKLDSVRVFSGDTRVQLTAQLSSDPKVKSYRVYWSNKKDSAVFPVLESQIATEITQIIDGLDENIYNFQIQTFDEEGNSSVPVFAIGRVYGERYRSSLRNRPLLKQDIVASNNTALIEFAPVDLTRGLVETEIEYTDNNNVTQSLTIEAANNEEFVLENFDAGNTFKYRSAFRPDTLSIDTFYTDFTVITPTVPITEAPYFKNASEPFKVGEFSGVRYGTPEDWIHNEGALNHNGFGVYDSNGGGGLFNLVSGYGEPNLVNAKVYQKMRIAAGTYTYTATTKGNNYNGVNDQVYMTAALGETLPDVVDVESSAATLGFERIAGAPRTYSITFTLTDDFTNIAIGLAATNGIDPNNPSASPTNINRYMTFRSFTLTKN